MSTLLCSVLALCGCAGGHNTHSAEAQPSFASEPYSRQQQLVNEGARLIISDGCSACHLVGSGHAVGPSFQSLAGHRIERWDGRRVLIDAHFLHQALLDPIGERMRGYPVQPMLAALKRTRLASHPDQLDALVAFIEQVGPE